MIHLERYNAKVIVANLGEVAFYFSFVFLVPLIVSIIYAEPLLLTASFALSFLVCMATGFILKNLFKTEEESHEIQAYVALVLVWFLLPLFGSLPYIFSINLAPLDAYFESVSGLTTTGLSNIGIAPNSILFWRAMEGWIGGAGIIVIALVGITIYTKKTKLFSIEGQERLRPSIIHTVRAIWWVYILITSVGVALLLVTGVPVFDSVTLSMSAISTTGAPNSADGLLHYPVPAQMALCIIMLMGATSFAVHYKFLKGKFNSYLADTEFRVMVTLLILGFLMTVPRLVALYGAQTAPTEAILNSVSSITGGGLHNHLANELDAVTKIVLIGLMVIGGSVGSTTGGIKTLRFWIFLKSIWWRIKSYSVPENAYFSRKIEGKEIEETEIDKITLFILLYLVFLFIGTLAVSYFEESQISNSLFEVASAQGNVGMSTGITNINMAMGTKVILIFNMLIGRLEVLPMFAAIGFLIKVRR